METEYDNNMLEYWKLPTGNYIVKLKKDDGLDSDNDGKTLYLVSWELLF